MIVMLERLKCFDILSGLSNDKIVELSKYMTPMSFDKGDVIILEEEPSDHIYLVDSGIIKVFRTSYDGKELILYFLRPGEVLNEAPLKALESNLVSAQALGPTKILSLSKDKFQRIITEEPKAAVKVLERICEQLKRIMNILGDIAFKKVANRLARIILEHVSDTTGTPRRISQQEMASMAGTAREVVSRSLRDLEDGGLIRIERNRIYIKDRASLERLTLGTKLN